MSTNAQSDRSRFVEAASACLSNGERLLNDADFLIYSEPPNTSFALALLAQEEFAKAFLMVLVSKGVIPWNALIYRATSDHTCKQLMGLVMSYISPDADEDFRRSMEWLKENEERKTLFAEYKSASDANEKERIWARIQEISEKHDSLPSSVVDAIYILRHDKIGHWESSTWFWAEEPVYDKVAKNLSDGKLDRKKQDAIYVRIARNGQVSKTPAQLASDDAKVAMEVADRMRSLVKSLLSGSVGGIEYGKIESAFKSVFANLSEVDRAEPRRQGVSISDDVPHGEPGNSQHEIYPQKL